MTKISLERLVGLICGVAILIFVMVVIWRDQPFSSPDLARMSRILLSLGIGVVGATIPGFLKVSYNIRGLSIRAAGGLGLFLITFFGSPQVEALHLADLSIAPVQLVEFRAVDFPATPQELNLNAPVAITVTFSLTNDADQLARPAKVEMTSLQLITQGNRYQFDWKYFVRHLTGAAYGQSPAERFLGVDSDAGAISVPAGSEGLIKEIMHVPNQLSGSQPTWISVVNGALDRQLTEVILFADTRPAGRFTARCMLAIDESANAIREKIAEKKIVPRYFQSRCKEAATWRHV